MNIMIPFLPTITFPSMTSDAAKHAVAGGFQHCLWTISQLLALVWVTRSARPAPTTTTCISVSWLEKSGDVGTNGTDVIAAHMRHWLDP